MHIGLGTERESGVELVENAKFTAHVVGGLGLATKGRPAQHELSDGIFQQVGQIRSSTWKLADA
ncbi:hypothetical protein D3C80_1858400 [compost metagenome]